MSSCVECDEVTTARDWWSKGWTKSYEGEMKCRKCSQAYKTIDAIAKQKDSKNITFNSDSSVEGLYNWYDKGLGRKFKNQKERYNYMKENGYSFHKSSASTTESFYDHSPAELQTIVDRRYKQGRSG